MIHTQDADFTLLQGDVLEQLATLPDESVHCVVTSPPYWGLRDYGTGEWAGGDTDCDHFLDARARRDSPGGFHNSQNDRSGDTQPATVTGRTPYGRECGKCGATRVDQQLGLEATPDQYVTRIVEVFREIRRVLRKDGTCWVNLGDSYGGYHGNNTAEPITKSESGLARNWYDANTENARPKFQPGTIKPKDLVGIPWRVAFALQQPYYTGRIKDERERIWLAATIEAEGCLFIHKRKEGQSNGQGYERNHASYGAGLEVASTDRVIVERCLEITGLGSVCEQTPQQNDRRKQTIYRWSLRSNVCRDVIRELYPHFIAKQHEARLLLGCPSSGPDAEKAHASLKAIHQGEKPDIDFAPPESMFEGGWYLRSDCIWSKKPNPMPESVTDRPTKAHEYVFLLTRSPRYYFDQDAVREPHLTNLPVVEKPTSRRVQPGTIAKIHEPGRDGWGSLGYAAGGRNVRSVWEIATQPYPEAHFATYPEELVRRCILAGTSEYGCCPVCGAPWEREVERGELRPVRGNYIGPIEEGHKKDGTAEVIYKAGRAMVRTDEGWSLLKRDTKTLGWRPGCDCPPNPIPCTVLDPFLGSGTTAHVARKHGRKSIGIELNPDYCQLAARRLQQQSLFA